MKEFMKKQYLAIVLAIVGAAGGFMYWKFVGCLTGSRPIKSRWYLMTIYGALIGYLIGSLAMDLILWNRKRKELKDRIQEK